MNAWHDLSENMIHRSKSPPLPTENISNRCVENSALDPHN
ncbi:hypothetical protein GcM3_157002, partial [Golovinomyces cichoracearum]